MTTIDVIVPVYRGVEATQRCIESVLSTASSTASSRTIRARSSSSPTWATEPRSLCVCQAAALCRPSPFEPINPSRGAADASPNDAPPVVSAIYLPSAMSADLEAHVAGCPRCTAFVASYRETPRILREASAVTMPPDLEASLLRFLRSRRGQ